MSSDYRDNRRLIKSFTFALEGIRDTFKQERNMKFHSVIAIFVIIMGFLLHVSNLEWIFILFAIGGMLSLELLNTAVERVVDLVTKDNHPLAKQAKDAAAGAVFIYAVLSVIVGCIIFLPKIF